MTVTGPNHALLIGHVLGGLLRAPVDYDVRPVYDRDGNYSDKIVVHAPSGDYVITVRPIEE